MSSPYNTSDVSTFVQLASVVENLGVSAYAGAMQYITDPVNVSIASTILSTEARHQAWQSSAIVGVNPWGSPFDTALTPNMVYTIAERFIISCPPSNPALAVKAYPRLTVNNEVLGQPGENSSFSWPNSMQSSSTNYAIFYSGIGSQAVELDSINVAPIPSSLQGISYVLISTASTAADVTDDNIVAGPATLFFTFNSTVSNPAFIG